MTMTHSQSVSLGKSVNTARFKFPPFDHQRKALELGRDREFFAYFMDQGTGKTKVLLDDAAHQYVNQRIDALVILTRNSVKGNWVCWPHSLMDGEADAVTTHMSPDVPFDAAVWNSRPTGPDKAAWKAWEQRLEQPKGLIVIAANFEAMLLSRFYEFLVEFMKAFRTMLVLDESTAIGEPGSKTTKAVLRAAKHAVIRRIATGTPVIKRLLKIYSQFEFLQPGLLGFRSYYAFRHRYCNMGGFENRQVISYKHLDELREKISAHSFRVLKEDCLTLPPKVYKKRSIEMTEAQVRAYREMKNTFEYEGITARLALTQLMRLQQVTGGYMTDGERTITIVPPERNPKMQEVMRLLEAHEDEQVIIWCRFQQEIAGLASIIPNSQIFDGSLAEFDKVRTRKDFAAGKFRVLIGNAAAGGIGIDEFKAASVVIYYSNDFNTERRVQSEDRTHRIGSERHKQIIYYDLLCPHTVDVKIVSTMRANKSISDQVMKDGIKEWI